MSPPAHPRHDTAPLEEPPHRALLPRAPAEEDAHPALHVPVHDLAQDLRAAAVQARDAVHVEDDVAVVLRVPDAWQGRVRGRGAVELQPAEPVLQLPRVGERQRLRDLDDQAPFDRLDALREEFRVLELRRGGPRDAAEDLDARLGGVADDGEEAEADAEGDAEREGVEDGGEEDERHEEELRVGAQAGEEEDVRRRFFDEGVGDDGYHGGEDGFLLGDFLSVCFDTLSIWKGGRKSRGIGGGKGGFGLTGR